MKRILITGGAGFLGSHLCERLLEEGHDIICLDNFFTGSKNNILHLLPHPHFELIRHDIINPIYLEIDEIYNLACPASPIHYQFNPIKTIKTSVMGAINTLGLAKRVKAKILQASTSEVYGDPEIHPQPETYWGRVNPIGIRSCYDEGKRAAECLMMDYHRQNHVRVKIVRIFHQDITVYGDGSQTRSFCYVDDMLDGFIRMMATPDDFIGPVNLGNPREFTILELAELLIRMTGSRAKIIFKPLPQDDPTQRKPDIRMAQKSLGWQPKIPLEEGIERTIAYFSTLV
jgi:UDP-glucuronate decarboxylase